jgi:hypothetical protein
LAIKKRRQFLFLEKGFNCRGLIGEGGGIGSVPKDSCDCGHGIEHSVPEKMSGRTRKEQDGPSRNAVADTRVSSGGLSPSGDVSYVAKGE